MSSGYLSRARELRQREADLAHERESLRQEADKTILREFGRRLREARAAAGLTQEQLADEVGLSRASIANAESGRQDMPLTNVVLLAEVLDVSPGALLDEI